LEQRFSKPEPIKEDADPVTSMKHRLKTAEGRQIYARRKCTVEPVFGIIKSVLGHRQLLRRGFLNAQSEWDLISMAWNLKRMHALAKLRPKQAESVAVTEFRPDQLVYSDSVDPAGQQRGIRTGRSAGRALIPSGASVRGC